MVPFLSALGWSVIAVMTYLNPSGTQAVSRAGPGTTMLFALSTGAAFALPCVALRSRDRAALIRRTALALVALLAMAWYFALTYHRDFFVFATEAVLLTFLTVLIRLESVLGTTRRREVYRSRSVAAFVTFVLWAGWLMLMPYAIVTRVEPRWIESIAYNLVNGLIALGLLIAAATLHARERRTLACRNGVIYLDDRRLPDVLSPQENRIVAAFLASPAHWHTCRSLLSVLRSEAVASQDLPDATAAHDPAIDCDRCLEERWTASNCAAYRNLKNRISATKKYLELLQIGTIVPVSENTRDIKETGWLLRLFDDVRIV
jgi:hypothetical protein